MLLHLLLQDLILVNSEVESNHIFDFIFCRACKKIASTVLHSPSYRNEPYYVFCPLSPLRQNCFAHVTHNLNMTPWPSLNKPCLTEVELNSLILLLEIQLQPTAFRPKLLTNTCLNGTRVFSITANRNVCFIR